MRTQQEPSCADCYFQKAGLCALKPERPCPTFRSHGARLRPPRQAVLVATTRGLGADRPAYSL